MKSIKDPCVEIIALDLDGTTLARRGLTKRTKRVLEEVIGKGVHVVIATGRSFSALPHSILEIKGLEYLVTSNGAMITSRQEDEVIYTDCIDGEKIDALIPVLVEGGHVVEAFTEGGAFIDKKVFEGLKNHNKEYGYLSSKYILRTRKPVDDIYEFLNSYREDIENINIIFKNQEDKETMRKALGAITGITLTSSMKNNIEIGGANTSKAKALMELCKILSIDMTHMMACGDSLNDIEMLKESGLAIAMGNSEDEVKKVCNVVVPTNDEEGVAYAIEKYVLNKNPDALEPVRKIKNRCAAVIYRAGSKVLKKIKR